MAKASSFGHWVRRVVAWWMWLRLSSLRSAFTGEPCLRKYCNSSQVTYSGEQSRRETAKAPQALAQVAQFRRVHSSASRAGSRT
jgi:hypothetical protein